MRRGKIIPLYLSVMLISIVFTGCTEPVSLGTATSTISVERSDYLATKTDVTAQDISHVIDYIDNLEAIVGDIGEYTTSYDKETNTVYVTTDTGNIAFYLDDDGYVLFASANGTDETKERLNQGIVQVSIGNYIANDVDDVLDQVEQTKWLNTINANVIAAEMEGFDVTQLTSLMYFETPTLDSLTTSDLERDVYGIGQVTMPVLTETLESYGIEDLTNYYESPTLSKFWTGLDTTSMEESIDKIVEDGIALGETYASATLEEPELEVSEWSLSSYTLPSTFSDGTSTGDLGQQTLDAYNDFYSALDTWKTELLEEEKEAQENGLASMQSGDTDSDGNVSSSNSDETSTSLNISGILSSKLSGTSE